MNIAIIGSGIAGLTLANLLQTNSNFEFVIYEKGEFLNLEEGFGIQLSANSVFILNKIGFNQLNVNEKYCPSKLDFYSINYNKICQLDLTKFNSENIYFLSNTCPYPSTFPDGSDCEIFNLAFKISGLIS